MYIQVYIKWIILITAPGYIMQQRISANHTLSPCFIVTCDDMIQFMTGNKWPITVVKLSCYIIVSCCDNFFSSNFVINVITSCKFLKSKLFILYKNIYSQHMLYDVYNHNFTFWSILLINICLHWYVVHCIYLVTRPKL